MSTILDALERAEQERNARRGAPEHEPLARPRKLWQRPGVWLLGAGLILLNGLVWWLMFEPETPPPIAATQPAPAQPAPRPQAPQALPQKAPLATAQAALSRPAPARLKPAGPEPVKPAEALAQVPVAVPAQVLVPPLLEEAAIRPPPSAAQPAVATPVKKTATDASKLAAQPPAESKIVPLSIPLKPQPEAAAAPAPLEVAKLSPPKALGPAKPATQMPTPTPQPAAPTRPEPAEPAAKPPEAQAKVPAIAEPAIKPVKEKVKAKEKAKEKAKPKSAKPVEEPAVVEAAPRIPAIWQLPKKAQKKLKGLEINIHVYNEVPEARFVIIDMHRYREGDILDRPGLKLESITRDGVVIDYGEGRVRF